MGNKLYEESSVQGIANAIRAKNGETTLYKISEMAAAIEAISGDNPLASYQWKIVGITNFTDPVLNGSTASFNISEIDTPTNYHYLVLSLDAQFLGHAYYQMLIGYFIPDSICPFVAYRGSTKTAYGYGANDGYSSPTFTTTPEGKFMNVTLLSNNARISAGNYVVLAGKMR